MLWYEYELVQVERITDTSSETVCSCISYQDINLNKIWRCNPSKSAKIRTPICPYNFKKRHQFLYYTYTCSSHVAHIDWLDVITMCHILFVNTYLNTIVATFQYCNNRTIRTINSSLSLEVQYLLKHTTPISADGCYRQKTKDDIHWEKKKQPAEFLVN